MAQWRVGDSRDLYRVGAWGAGLFDVDERGHVVARAGGGELDLHQLVLDCVARGLRLPLLIRLPDVLEARIEALVGTFARTIAAAGYGGRHRGVYPIKVNQQRYIVEDLLAAARPHHFGLECGSKPELQVALALVDDPDALIIVNGYKDRDLIEMAIASRRIGRDVIVVVEQPHELEACIDVGRELGIRPSLGVRIKLGRGGAGRWEASSGERAKFGLTMQELLAFVAALRDSGELGALRLLHFHIGSQVTAIRAMRDACRDAARVYCELVRLGAPLTTLDVGGGLGVDYDGSRTDFESSMNYDLSEYVEVIIDTVRAVCDEAGVAHPDIVTESGRWLVAPSAVLVTSVLAATGPSATYGEPEEASPYGSVEFLRSLTAGLTRDNAHAAFHRATSTKEETLDRFMVGDASLHERAAVEAAFRTLCERLVTLGSVDELPHEEFEGLPKLLADTYLCNFSVFQSMPDSWAVSQLFPVMPLGRLDEYPSRRCTIADLTCDSDGKIDRFIDRRDVRDTLEVHSLNGEPYFIGVFLLGAYQETLGDLHNLFGDTNAVHVRVAPGVPGYRIEHVSEGDTVADVLGYMQYDKKTLIAAMRRSIEDAHARGEMDLRVGSRLMELYAARLASYTYLHERYTAPPAPHAGRAVNRPGHERR